MTDRSEDEPRQQTPGRRRALGLPIIVGVVLVAIVAAVLLNSDTEPIIEADYVEWTRQNASTSYTGPGGFIRRGARRLQFSANGDDWSPIDLSSWPNESPANTNNLQVFSTEALWLVVVPFENDESEAWKSADGTSWTRFLMDPDITRAGASRSGFLGRSGDDYWRSEDLENWQPIDLPFGRRKARDFTLFGANRGFAFIQNGLTSPIETHVSVDGSSWVAGAVDFSEQADSMDMVAVEHVANRWILMGTKLDDGKRELHVWTSSDGASWQFAGVPDFVRGGMTHSGLSNPRDDLVTVSLHREGIRPFRVVEVWVTSDGTTWERALERNRISGYAVKDNGDGTYTGVYSGSRN